MSPDFYVYIVAILVFLAVADLVVGVSNDAVNFLNSAIGSRVAPRHIILIVASAGVILGALFSNGMMEVARKGIFNPASFSFDEVMIIFLAVMLTDVILLDVFNTFGLPTSTTVSLVFELLGAAVAVSVFKVLESGQSLSVVGQYINSANTLTIVSSIFLSVSISFVVGAFVQWLSRFLFSFQYLPRLKWVGGVWSGLALTAILYFLLFKGLKGASFISSDFVAWVNARTTVLLVGTFVVSTLLMQALLTFFRVNVLRLVVLSGTFALAMAFAGNDLVNFIGVPLAGLDAFQTWQRSGLEPGALGMESLSAPVQTNTYFLLFAGVVMILTLWFSRKARTVTDTEVSLGSHQEDGVERFNSNWLARGIVWYTRKLTEGLARLIPGSWLHRAAECFKPAVAPEPHRAQAPAFDLVRASVNLTVSASLIASATALKLPLSTTYVTFMVAMGTSLADRAWGRGSAVYRVAGVLNVIGGWFLTAVIAFTVACLWAGIIHFFGIWGVIGIVLLVVGLVSRTFVMHRAKERLKAHREKHEHQTDALTARHIIDETAQYASDLLQKIALAYRQSVEGLLQEDRKQLEQARQTLKKLEQQSKDNKGRLFHSIKRLHDDAGEAGKFYLLVYDLEQDLLQSARLIVHDISDYVEDSLPSPNAEQGKRLSESSELLESYIQHIRDRLMHRDFDRPEVVLAQRRALLRALDNGLKAHIDQVKKGKNGRRGSMLVFSIELETKDLITLAARFFKLFSRMEQYAEQQPPRRYEQINIAKQNRTAANWEDGRMFA